MEVVQSLALIKLTCEDFKNLPNHMKDTIQKEDLEEFLTEKIKDGANEILVFMSLIFDEVKIKISLNIIFNMFSLSKIKIK